MKAGLGGQEKHDLAAADLSRILGGSRNLGAMILRGDRNLTLALGSSCAYSQRYDFVFQKTKKAPNH